jgi:hypothetical protein
MLYEIGTRVKIETVIGDFNGTIQSIKEQPDKIPLYMVLVDLDSRIKEQDRLMGSLLVFPLEA